MDTTASSRGRRPLAPLRDFLRTEGAGGLLLALAALLALVWANSPWKSSYHSLWAKQLTIDIGDWSLGFDLRHWVNDGLMALFFLVVGLEIKREMTDGHLSTRRTASLPVVAAIGGMAVPALLYLAIAGGEAPRGWGVPMATDIALAVALITVLGARVSAGGRAFLLGLAVVDDIGAIVVIAVFYSAGVSGWWLLAAAGAVGLVVVLTRIGVTQFAVFVLIGLVMWYSLYEAGVHPTLAGVAMGLLAPTTPAVRTGYEDVEQIERGAGATVSVVEWLEHRLHPWTGFVIVPLFALANSGIEISASSLRSAVESPVAWGVFVGLVVGKPLGVVVLSLAATRTSVADRPVATSTITLLGLGQAAGIGFTVALFVAELAFESEDHLRDAKLAILVASVTSAIVAAGVLMATSRARRPPPEPSRRFP